MKIAIIGLGLIGGSFAQAIKQKTGHTVFGLDIDAATVQAALSSGAIDGLAQDHYEEVDLVLIALYPHACIQFLSEHVDLLPGGCLIIDLCGVKRYVCRQAAQICAGRPLTFIGGHPMAGREASGFTAASPELFHNASMILTPDQDVAEDRLLWADAFFRQLGFSAITVTTPEHHDQVIAYTSQLAHVVSSAYVLSPCAGQHQGFSAGSFNDLTRVAKLHEGMWTELFLENHDYLTGQLDCLIANLQQYRQAISEQDAATLRQKLAAGRLRKESL